MSESPEVQDEPGDEAEAYERRTVIQLREKPSDPTSFGIELGFSFQDPESTHGTLITTDIVAMAICEVLKAPPEWFIEKMNEIQERVTSDVARLSAESEGDE